MKCQYPNCHKLALWTPVVELPTLRTAGDEGEMVKTDRPTVLLGREVCQDHRDTYNLADWMPAGDWAVLQEAARANGYVIPDAPLIGVQFRPVGWKPNRTLEVERT